MRSGLRVFGRVRKVRRPRPEVVRQFGVEVREVLLLTPGDVVCPDLGIGRTHGDSDALAFVHGIDQERDHGGAISAAIIRV